MRPIYIIGAGGIVNDAHLPAYQLAGYAVEGIYDRDVVKAQATAARFGVTRVFNSLKDLLVQAPADAVFDIALPADAVLPVLDQLPDGATVLMQKPMGNNLEEAGKIVALTSRKKMKAGVNFQLRYAPYVKTARELLAAGVIGELCDVEVNVNVFTPWHLWEFLYNSPRVEILYHSVHYIDLVRSFLGNPYSVYAKTTRHPLMSQLSSVRSNIIMDYGDSIRAAIATNHTHVYGEAHQQAYIKLEGTRGAIKMTMGSLINYPGGIPDVFEYITLEDGSKPEWKTLPVEGSWFPHAFIGAMKQVMAVGTENAGAPDNTVTDAFYTMACVEAAYQSSEAGGVPLQQFTHPDAYSGKLLELPR